MNRGGGGGSNFKVNRDNLNIWFVTNDNKERQTVE
jgi:hypothetical protein